MVHLSYTPVYLNMNKQEAKEMTEVDKIAEIRYLYYIKGFSIRDVAKKIGISKTTVQKVLKSNLTKFTYERSEIPCPVTGPFTDTIEKWLKEDLSKRRKNRRTAVRIYEILK